MVNHNRRDFYRFKFATGRLLHRSAAPAGPNQLEYRSHHGLPRVLQGLPEDRRRALLQDVDVSRREIASRHRALQKVQIDIERAMAMEPFDAESLANALENFRRRFDENQEDSHRLLVQLFEQMDPEERSAVRIALSRLRARPNQGRPRDIGPKRPPPRFNDDRGRSPHRGEERPRRPPSTWNRPSGGN